MSEALTSSRSGQKRRQILDAGRELFMAQGFAETSMDQVTARSGVSKATVYNHFPSKERLFEECVRTRAEEVFSALPELDPEHRDPEDLLTEFFTVLLNNVLSEDGAGMCFLLMSEGRRFPENARLIYESGFGRGLREMSAYLSQLAASGRLKIDDPQWAAARLLGLMLPPLPMMCAGFQPLQIPGPKDVRSAVQLFLHGVSGANARGTARS
jgi:TetR/AcrR family transcriptional repressor of mexJK operon